jgi:hypothetical protein
MNSAGVFGFGITELILVAFCILFIYIFFIPSVIAYKNSKDNRFVILLINIFFGGTGLGWLVALALALSGNEAKSPRKKKK